MKSIVGFKKQLHVSPSSSKHRKPYSTRIFVKPDEYRPIFEEYMRQNNISYNDFYQISPDQIADEKTSNIINKKFRGSIYKALSSVFPETQWVPWQFEYRNAPSGFWKDMSNQRKFFDDLGKKLGVKTLDDWYDKYEYNTLAQSNGMSIMKFHRGSAVRALCANYPEHNWIPWKFKFTVHGFWKSIENQRQYFDWLGKELGIEKLDDWYRVTNRMIEARRGASLLRGYYNGSVIDALKVVYPEHNWIEWKFKAVSKDFWKSYDNVSKFLADLSEQLSIQTLDDWYRVDWLQVNKLGGATLIKASGGLYPLLKQQYPHHPWDRRKFSGRKKAQRWLAVTLRKIFPEEEIIEDYIHPKAMFHTGRPMQLDVFLPKKSLAFEYQGEQHFQDLGIYSPQRIYQERDAAKRILCAENNIKLVEVPYWWNRTQDDLQHLIATGKLPERGTKSATLSLSKSSA